MDRNMNDLSRILIIEDNQEVVEAVSLALQIRWPRATVISTDSGEKGIELVEKMHPDIVILDLGLPDISGFEVLKGIRNFSSLPIVILSVRGEEADVVKGLELGADEYIVKPFRQLELLSRIKALTRRKYTIEENTPIVSGLLCLYPLDRVVKYNGRDISLTHSESVILQQLMKRAGTVTSNAIIAQGLWGDSFPDAISGIKVYIRRLRQKIEQDPDHPKLILTRHGVGYLFAKSD
jgi:two-component system response regulator VicR